MGLTSPSLPFLCMAAFVCVLVCVCICACMCVYVCLYVCVWLHVCMLLAAPEKCLPKCLWLRQRCVCLCVYLSVCSVRRWRRLANYLVALSRAVILFTAGARILQDCPKALGLLDYPFFNFTDIVLILFGCCRNQSRNLFNKEDNLTLRTGWGKIADLLIGASTLLTRKCCLVSILPYRQISKP